MKRNNKRKLIGITSALVLLLTVGAIGVTFAMIQTQTVAAVNNFAGARVNVGVVENGEATIYEDGNNTVVYDTINSTGIDKEVAIINKNSVDFPTADTYVRVRLVPIFRDGSGATVPMAAGELDKVVYSFAADSKWKVQTVDGEDYYYYSEALAPGETSGALIEKVAFTGTAPANTTFELQVLVEGIAANQPGSLQQVWGIADQTALNALPTVNN